MDEELVDVLIDVAAPVYPPRLRPVLSSRVLLCITGDRSELLVFDGRTHPIAELASAMKNKERKWCTKSSARNAVSGKSFTGQRNRRPKRRRHGNLNMVNLNAAKTSSSLPRGTSKADAVAGDSGDDLGYITLAATRRGKGSRDSSCDISRIPSKLQTWANSKSQETGV